MHIVNRSQNWN